MALRDQGYTGTEKGLRIVLWTWTQTARSGLIRAAQQLATNLHWATYGNPAGLMHDYLGIQGRVLVQNIRGNVKAVLQAIQVVFFYSLRLHCMLWDVAWRHNATGTACGVEESNRLTLYPYCWLGTDPGACSPLRRAQHHPQRAQAGRGHRGTRDTRVQVCFPALFHLAAQQPKGFVPSRSFRKWAGERGTGPRPSSSKVLSDSLLPQVSSKTRIKLTLEPKRPNHAGWWLSHPRASTLWSCRAAWNRDKLCE